MEKVRDPVLLLAVDFIADQRPRSKAGIGAVSAFQVPSAHLHRAAPTFLQLFCRARLGVPDRVLPCPPLLSLSPRLPAFAYPMAF